MNEKHLKKWLLCILSLFGGVMFAEAQVTESTKYLLNLEGTELYFSAETAAVGDNSELSLQFLSEEGYAQTVEFSNHENGCNITVGGSFAIVREEWYLRYKNLSDVTLTDNNAIFSIESLSDGRIKLKNLGTGKYIGCDDRTRGSRLYSDKDGEKVCIFVLKAENDVKQELTQLISEAGTLLSETQEGSETGQYPAEARNTLSKEIDAAKSVLTGPESAIEDFANALTRLKNAISAYRAQQIKPPFKEGVYKLYHVANEGSILASGWHANKWESPNVENTALILPENELGEYNGQFTFEKTDNSNGVTSYDIFDHDDNPLVNNDGKLYVGNSQTDLTDADAIFTVEPVDGSQVRVRSSATGNCVGPINNTKGWSWIHAGTNHTGTEDGDLFRTVLIKEIITGTDQIAINKKFSIKVRNNTVSIEGAPHAVIYTMEGTKVIELGGGSEATLLPGVYIVATDINDCIKSMKIVVK